MFADFDEWDLDVSDAVTIRGRSGGAGPAIVLLHGHPRAHTTWHLVAPLLVGEGFTVVCPDLRGYGRSSKPEPTPDHETYCDRVMASDIAAVMSRLGHKTFTAVGHDRGQGVAYRTALDHPDRVEALGVLDGLPHPVQYERVDARFATEWWHWFFFAGSPHAERVINADPDAWYSLDEDKRSSMGEGNFSYVAAALHDPMTVRAMLEDYRAGLGIDVAHDRDDLARGRTIGCPTLVAWSIRDDMEDLYGDLVPLWQPWVSAPITRARIDSGHHMAEENPGQLASVISAFRRGLSSVGTPTP